MEGPAERTLLPCLATRGAKPPHVGVAGSIPPHEAPPPAPGRIGAPGGTGSAPGCTTAWKRTAEATRTATVRAGDEPTTPWLEQCTASDGSRACGGSRSLSASPGGTAARFATVTGGAVGAAARPGNTRTHQLVAARGRLLNPGTLGPRIQRADTRTPLRLLAGRWVDHRPCPPSWRYRCPGRTGPRRLPAPPGRDPTVGAPAGCTTTPSGETTPSSARDPCERPTTPCPCRRRGSPGGNTAPCRRRPAWARTVPGPDLSAWWVLP